MSAAPASLSHPSKDPSPSLFRRAFALAWGVCFALSPVALAEDLSVQPDVQNSKVQAVGEINSNAVYVRCGPGENYYPTMKLDKGDRVTVVGMRFDWLKIQPPPKSFSYVAQAFVEKFGDGTRGKVTEGKDALNVRAGSELNDIKAIVQTQLHGGDEVQIIGVKDEYYMIKPPAGAYLYVKKDFVSVVKAEPAVAEASKAPAPQANPQARPSDSDGSAHSGGSFADEPAKPAEGATAEASGQAVPTTAPSENGEATAAAPTTQGSGQGIEVAAAPSTRPSAPAPEVVFDKLEGDFLATAKQPLDQQPVAELLKSYQELSKDEKLPESMRRITDYRVATLQARVQAQQELAAVRKQQEEMAQRRMAMKAEQDELIARIKATEVKVFAAVGTLQTSSLQLGGGTLYRLTDPANGRTLVYVRTSDAKYAGYLGKFIGLRGEVTRDMQNNLRFVSPTEVETVDPGQVNSRVTAAISPPSLLRAPVQTEASTGNQ